MISQRDVDNWFTYHAPEGDQQAAYESLRSSAKTFANAINDLVPDGPDKTAAMRKLRECLMTANAAIACNPPQAQTSGDLAVSSDYTQVVR